MALTGESPFGLLRLGGPGRPPPTAAPPPVEAWWIAASHGHWRPRAVPLPPVTLPDDPARWCAAGGMTPGPRNAAALARLALLALPPGAPCPEAVVLLVAAPVAPHAWRVAGGGVPISPGRWVRRYAALPADAPLGAWTHELAHLLLDWPDLPGSPCLMGHGAHRGDGHDPAPPCPALSLAAGWLTPRGAEPATPIHALRPDGAFILRWHGTRLLLTRSGSDLLIHRADRPAPPLATARSPDPTLPLIATVAAALEAAPITERIPKGQGPRIAPRPPSLNP